MLIIQELVIQIFLIIGFSNKLNHHILYFLSILSEPCRCESTEGSCGNLLFHTHPFVFTQGKLNPPPSRERKIRNENLFIGDCLGSEYGRILAMTSSFTKQRS